MTRLTGRQFDLVPGVDISHEELADFKMPHVEPGMLVYWWDGAQKSGRRPAIAVVTRVAGRNIDVFCLATRIAYDHVRHITDPKIRLNEEQRDMGAWERVPSELRVDERLTTVEDRLAALEETLTAVRSRRETDGGSSDYQGLLRRAKSLGIPFARNPKKEWLVAKIAEAEAAQGEPPTEDGEDTV